MTELPRNPDGSIDVRSQEFYRLRVDTFMSRPARDMWMIATLRAGFDPDELWQEIRRQRAELANRQGGGHELAVATGRVAALRDEIKKHELIYDMLERQRPAKRPRRGRPPVEPLKRGPRVLVSIVSVPFVSTENGTG